MQAQLEKLQRDAAECALIRDLATDPKKRELFARLAEHRLHPRSSKLSVRARAAKFLLICRQGCSDDSQLWIGVPSSISQSGRECLFFPYAFI